MLKKKKKLQSDDWLIDYEYSSWFISSQSTKLYSSSEDKLKIMAPYLTCYLHLL